MTIKELEEKLEITRGNIRFYEKEGLLLPDRRENSYREYNDNDVEKLKNIIILRKLGIPIEDIRNIFDEKVLLHDAVQKQIMVLNTEIKELKCALDVCILMEQEDADIQTIDTNNYWDMIKNKEKQGQTFADIYKDYLDFELTMFDNMWKNAFLHNFKNSRNKYGVRNAIILLFIICVIRGLSSQFLWKDNFLQGFLYPFELFGISSFIILPLFYLRKKKPKLAEMISSFLLYAIFSFIVIVLVLQLFLL